MNLKYLELWRLCDLRPASEAIRGQPFKFFHYIGMIFLIVFEIFFAHKFKSLWRLIFVSLVEPAHFVPYPL